MKTTLCTLYNSLYLDKGLVLYDSLKECAKDFELYVLCMDEKCYEVLLDLGENGLKPIRLSDVENEKMLEAKSNRSIAEYCWTCSSRLIQYILKTFQPECCTYIDADMYFYHDPCVLIEEMLSANKSVMMVPHRFTVRNQYLAEKVGTYCVEFNTFINNKEGREVLDYWHNKCWEFCGQLDDGIHWGDQKYMDEWIDKFPDVVHPCENNGAGIAPWNIELYNDYNNSDHSITYRKDNQRIPIVFYHFQSIAYLSRKRVSTGIESNLNADYKSIEAIYRFYLQKIEDKKIFLKKQYQVDLLLKRHPASKGPRWKRFLMSFFVFRKLIKMVGKSNSYFEVNLS